MRRALQTIGIMAGGVATTLLLLFALKRPNLPKVEAQAQTSFSQNFTFTGANQGVNQYIKIPNRAQTAHTVEIRWSSGSGCPIQLDGSADGTNWFAIASAANPTNALSTAGYEFLTANGYFTFLRIKVFGSTSCSGIAHTGTYTGYQCILPVSNILTVADYNNFKDITQLTFVTLNGPANGIKSFQCLNTNASSAWLQIFNSVSPASLGPGFLYQMVIGASSPFIYSGPEIVGQNTFWVGAATADSGNTKVTNPVICNFQEDFSGPWLPTLLASP